MRNACVYILVAVGMLLAGCGSTESVDYAATPYLIRVPVQSRSASFENPTGAKGEGGKAAHPTLGPGRKGSPLKTFKPGQEEILCDIGGPGVIRHIWMTTNNSRKALLGLIVRAWWDGQDHPSIEVPVGNFFGLSYGLINDYESIVHAVNPNAGMNINTPMPFAKRARMTVTNETDEDLTIYYSIDYTVNDPLPDDFGRLHVLYRRENPTSLKQDFEILPKRSGSGRYLGCILGIRPVEDGWWGEGEFKVYVDGDEQWPTIVGTGTEDYNLQSYGVQDRKYLFAGTNLIHFGLHSIYRWHWRDPIYWEQDIRVTIQQIGYYPGDMYDRRDDWSATTFWYESVPGAPLPPMTDTSGDDLHVEDYMREWLVLGPFQDRETELRKRLENDHVRVADLRPGEGASIAGRQWERIEAKFGSDLVSDSALGVDLLDLLFGPRQRSVAYAHQYLESEKEQKIPLRLFSSDGVKVWLNGDEIFQSRDLHRLYMMETCELPLKKGPNLLLLKVLQGRTGWSFGARIDNRHKLGIRYSTAPDPGLSSRSVNGQTPKS